MILRTLAVLALLTACETTADDAPAPTEAPTEIMSLAGSEWKPVEMDDGAPEVFLQFKADGEISGAAGCNRVMGTYVQQGTSLTFGPLATTRMLCSPSVMDVERAFLAALKKVASADASHVELKLFDAEGTALLELRRTDWD